MTTTRTDSFRLKAMCVALIAVFPVVAEAGVAGRVQFVAGDVRAIDEKGNERALKKGEDVNEGDTLRSDARGSAQLKMVDGAIVAVRPGTELKVIDYVFHDKEDGSESASFSLVKGGLRAITGLIGKTNKDKYKITTPTATIGIRGTDHEPLVVSPAQGALDGTPPGTYDKVNVGATTLTNNAGVAVVGPNQVGFAGSPSQPPVLLSRVPEFYRATPTPDQQNEPEGKDDKESTQAQGKEQGQQQAGEQTQQAQQTQSGQTQTSSSTAGTTSAGSVGATPLLASVTTVSGTGITGTTSTTGTAPAATLTAVDAAGNTLNVANQTVTTSTGTVTTVDGGTVLPQPGTNPGPTPGPVQSDGPHTELIAAYPGFNSSDPSSTFAYPAVFYFDGPTSAVVRDPAGNLTGVTNNAGSYGYQSTLAQTGSTLTNLGSDATTGLSWGRWQGGTVTQTSQYLGVDASGNWGIGATDSNGNFVIGEKFVQTGALGSGSSAASLHWISGPTVKPDYLPQVLTGSANYSLIGGTTPTDQHGNSGSLNSASLGVNFTTGIANATLNFSINSNTWNMQSGDMVLQDRYFSSNSYCSSSPCPSSVTLTRNGTAIGSTPPTDGNGSFAFGSMNGSLTGAGLNGAALQYAVQEWVMTPMSGTTNNVIQGVAAFSGPAQNVNTPFRAVGITDGWNGNYSMGSDDFSMDNGPLYRGSIDGGMGPAARVVMGAGGLTEFLGEAMDYTPVSASSASNLDTSATIKIGTAINQDVGSVDFGGTTVSWGRWEGGNIDIYSRDGSAKLGSIDNTGRSVHWLATSVLTDGTAFTSLPLTGTATYAHAGHTRPTDLLGNVGTLNSVTLSADFGAGKVNAGVNVSFIAPTNTSNWTMSANNIPLSGSDGFGSSTALNGMNGITHTATCSGVSCGSQTIGHVDGVFFNGGQGAMLMYGMSTGNPSTSSFTPLNSVTGLAIMKK